MFSLFQPVFKRIEFRKTLEEDKKTENDQNDADTFSDSVRNGLSKHVMKLFSQENLQKVDAEIGGYYNPDVEQEITRIGILISHRNNGNKPKQDHADIQHIEKKPVYKGFHVVLADELIFVPQVHFGPCNEHYDSVNKYQDGSNPVETGMFIDQVYDVVAGKICCCNTEDVCEYDAQVQCQCMLRPARKAGFDQQKENGSYENKAQH